MASATLTRLADTSILVDFLRGNQVAESWLNQFSTGEVAISVVTAAELIAGCRNRREQKQVEQDLEIYPTVWISGSVSAVAWEWYRTYRLKDGVGFLDCLIGATAHQHGLTICTLNDKHFRPFPDVKVERPY